MKINFLLCGSLHFPFMNPKQTLNCDWKGGTDICYIGSLATFMGRLKFWKRGSLGKCLGTTSSGIISKCFQPLWQSVYVTFMTQNREEEKWDYFLAQGKCSTCHSRLKHLPIARVWLLSSRIELWSSKSRNWQPKVCAAQIQYSE